MNGLRLAAACIAAAALLAAAGATASAPPRPDAPDLPGDRDWRQVPPRRIERPPRPDLIDIRQQDDGETLIVGRAGAAGDERAGFVRVINVSTVDEVVAQVAADGSFQVRMVAPPGSSLELSTLIALPPMPEDLRRGIGSPGGLRLGAVREIVNQDIHTSPALILPVRLPGDPDPLAAGFVAKPAPDVWMFGTARVSRRAFEPGQAAEIEVDLSVRFASEADARRRTDRPPRLHPNLSPLFDARGRQLSGLRLLASHVLTPTQLPIETQGDLQAWRDPEGRLRFEPGPGILSLPHEPVARGRWQIRGGLARVRGRLRMEVPADTPPGEYALRLHIIPPGDEPEPGPGVLQAEVPIGRVTVAPAAKAAGAADATGDATGAPAAGPTALAAPRLAAMLLGSAGPGGYRGTIAREDRGLYGVAPHTVFLPAGLVIPRDDARTGRPIRYPLDPYLPLVSLTDRPQEDHLWPPRIHFAPDCGGLTVTVQRPDGGTDRLGPARFVSARNDMTCVCPDRTIRDRLVAPRGGPYGNPSLCDIYHLSGGGAFDYAFADYGHYVVALDGSARDVTGADHVIRGTYDVYVARPVDIDVFPEPGTPLGPGVAYHPQVRVLPAMPAEVELVFTYVPGSEESRTVVRRVAGRANRWGVFVPGPGEEPVRFAEPGEYRCDVTVRHVDAAGTWWMACRRGASVIVTPDSAIVVHGERGNRDPNGRWRARWFIAPTARFIGKAVPEDTVGHTCYPYEPGDVAWLYDEGSDSLFPNVTFEDPGGKMAALVEARWPAVRDGAGRAGLYPHELLPEDRLAIGEMPFVCSSSAGLSPALAPERVDQWGYFYTTSWRPGVSVRCHVGEDMVPASYWFFDDPYGYQFGAGPRGDLPGDVKMNYAGTVFRDAKTGVRHYGAYASMVTFIDHKRDRVGRRVMPPFDGLLPGSPPSGALLEVGGRRYDVFLTFGAVGPGAVLEVGGALAVSGVVWPPVSGAVAGTVTSPSGRRTDFETPADAVGVFDYAASTADEPGLWTVRAEGVCTGRTSAGVIADLVPKDRWPRGGGVGLDDATFAVPVVAAGAEPIAFDLPAGTRAAPPAPLVIRGRLPQGCTAAAVHVVTSLPGAVIEQRDLPAANGEFTYAYDAEALAALYPNIDTRLPPAPGPMGDAPAWYDTVTFTFWAGEGADLRAGCVLLQGEDVYAGAATGRPPPADSSAPRRPVLAGQGTDRPAATAAPRPDLPGAGRARHTSLVAISADGASLFAAHPYSGEVARLSLAGETPRVEAAAQVGGHVRSIGLSADGTRLYAACGDARQVVVLDTATLTPSVRLDVPGEPWAALPAADGKALFVADFDGHRVLRLDAATGRVEAAATVPRPACLAASADGREVYAVAFRTGEVAVLDAAGGLVRRLPAPAQLNQCRTVTPGPDGRLYMPQTRSDTVVGGRMFDRTVFPAVAVADPAGGGVSIALSPDLLTIPPHRPVEVALDADTLYLAGQGSDDVVAVNRRTNYPRWHAERVGLEPGGMALDAARGRLYVLTVTGQEIVTLEAQTGRVLSRVPFARDPTDPLIARGRYLFGTATDKRLTKDHWMSCAVCHPDGDVDGRQWDFGEGPLDTHTLRGCADTAPLHVDAHLDEIQDTAPFTRMVMGGRWFVGRDRERPYFGDPNAGLNRDLDALAAYIESLTPKRPPSPPAALAATIRRGKELFLSEATGCSRCHMPPLYTDSGRRDAQGAFLRHDVGTWKTGEGEALRKLDTPSLLDLRQSEPYLHDGRAATLEEVFTKHNPDDRHGRTSHLAAEDIRALSEFLRWLDPGPPQPRPPRPGAVTWQARPAPAAGRGGF